MFNFSKNKTKGAGLLVVVFIGVLFVVLMSNNIRYSLFGRAASGTPCNTLSSNVSVPTGWGASYDVFSPTRDLLIKTICSNTSVTIEVGTGSPNQFIYKTGYEWKNNQRNTITFTGTQSEYADWLIGPATTTLQYTAEELKGKNAVNAYVCIWKGAQEGYKCGCADAACVQPFWQLQEFTYNASAPNSPMLPPSGMPTAEPSQSGAPSPTTIPGGTGIVNGKVISVVCGGVPGSGCQEGPAAGFGIIITDVNNNTVKSITLPGDGTYSSTLSPGTYTATITGTATGTPTVQKQFTIQAGTTVQVDIRVVENAP